MWATPRGESRFDAIALLVTEPTDCEGAEIIPPVATPTRQRRMQQAIQSHFARFSSDFLPKIEHEQRDKRRTLAGSASENSAATRARR
jgi:hypothetical protein